MPFGLILVDIYCSKFMGWKSLSVNELASTRAEFSSGGSRESN